MVRIGSRAPTFHCTAVINQEVMELGWNSLHERKVLVISFESSDLSSEYGHRLVVLSRFADQLNRLHAKIALVVHTGLFDVLSWLERYADPCGLADFPFPIVVDSDNRIATLYGMIGTGESLRGQILVDARGIVRHMAITSVPMDVDLAVLMPIIRAARWSPAREEDRSRGKDVGNLQSLRFSRYLEAREGEPWGRWHEKWLKKQGLM